METLHSALETWRLCTLHSALEIWRLCILHQRPGDSALCTLHWRLCTLHWRLYTLHWRLCTKREPAPETRHSAFGTLHSAPETVSLCTLHQRLALCVRDSALCARDYAPCARDSSTLHWRLCHSGQEALPRWTGDSATLNWRPWHFALETLAFCIGDSGILHWRLWHFALETLAFCIGDYPFRSFSGESAWQVAGCCCLRFGLAAALLPRPAGRHPKPFWFKVQGFLGLRWRRVLPAWGGSGRPPAVDGVMWALSYRSRGRRRAGITSCAWLGERCARASRLWLRVPARLLRRKSRCLLRWPHRAGPRLR